MQRAAIEGEIAYLITTATSDSEILFRLYFVLSEADDSLKEIILECFKSLVYFPEEVYTRILGEISTKNIPMWLWEDKVIDDIKEVIKHGEAPDSSNLKLEKRDLRKVVAKSAFILFCKRLCAFSVSVPINLCKKILDNHSLDFLHSSCFALIRDLSEAVEMGVVSLEDSKENLLEIFKMSFDARDILSFRIEVEALEHLNNLESKRNSKHFSDEMRYMLDRVENEDSNDVDDDNQLDQILSNLMETHNKEVEKGRKRKNPFVVKKIFREQKTVSTLKTFKSKEEAVVYIEKIVDRCPELMNTCTFVIEDFNVKNEIYIFSEG